MCDYTSTSCFTKSHSTSPLPSTPVNSPKKASAMFTPSGLAPRSLFQDMHGGFDRRAAVGRVGRSTWGA